MKKMYSKPQMEVVSVSVADLLANSNSITGPEGTGYGGVDEDGSIIPAARRHHGVWEDDEEEEDEW